MTPDAALAAIAAALRTLGVAPARTLTPEVDLRRDLGIDSVDLLDLLFALNAATGVSLTLEALAGRAEPSRVATVVAALVEASAGTANAARTDGEGGAA